MIFSVVPMIIAGIVLFRARVLPAVVGDGRQDRVGPSADTLIVDHVDGRHHHQQNQKDRQHADGNKAVSEFLNHVVSSSM